MNNDLRLYTNPTFIPNIKLLLKDVSFSLNFSTSFDYQYHILENGYMHVLARKIPEDFKCETRNPVTIFKRGNKYAFVFFNSKDIKQPLMVEHVIVEVAENPQVYLQEEYCNYFYYMVASSKISNSLDKFKNKNTLTKEEIDEEIERMDLYGFGYWKFSTHGKLIYLRKQNCQPELLHIMFKKCIKMYSEKNITEFKKL